MSDEMEMERTREFLLELIRLQKEDVDEQIRQVQAQSDETARAQRALEQIEAVLLRMAMLAREAAQAEARRPGIIEEYEDCKKLIEELSEFAVLGGVNLVRDGEGAIARAIEEAGRNVYGDIPLPM